MELDVFSLPRTPAEAANAAAQIAAAGFAGWWIPEGSRSPFSLCAAASLSSGSLTLGTGVSVAFARSPMVLAQEAWMLTEATGGRFLVGLGTQVRAHVERRYSAAFDHPGPRIVEYVASLRAIFAAFRGQSALRFDGDFYSFSLLPQMWSPGDLPYADPPIYVAGVRPYLCGKIGETADGMYVHPLHSVRYLDTVVIPNVTEGARRAGRTAAPFAYVVPLMTAVSDDEADLERQREQIRERLAFYGSTPGYGVVFEASGFPGTGERLVTLQRSGDLKTMVATITDEMIDAFSLTAGWDDLATKLAERYGQRADRIVCYSASSQWADDPDSRERWTAVVAEFARRSPTTGSPAHA
jgi:probable F420-dependent oxidoreductase